MQSSWLLTSAILSKHNSDFITFSDVNLTGDVRDVLYNQCTLTHEKSQFLFYAG